VFHVSANPPKVAGTCDHCQGRLILRDDDKPETIRVRMQAYENEILPLIEYYDDQGKLIQIRASGNAQEVFRRVMRSLAEIDIDQPCVPAQPLGTE
jgi:adenylate kinase